MVIINVVRKMYFNEVLMSKKDNKRKLTSDKLEQVSGGVDQVGEFVKGTLQENESGDWALKATNGQTYSIEKGNPNYSLIDGNKSSGNLYRNEVGGAFFVGLSKDK
jgi:lipopolysaccharide export LptBFGC system permease protein LptF